MSTPYAGTATYHATIPLPADGDNRNATVLNAALEKIVDRTAFLNGGTLAPAASIEIGGAGIDLSGANHVLSGTLTSSSGILAGIFTVSGSLYSSGGTFSGSWAGSASFTGNPGFSGNPVFTGAPSFPGVPVFSGGLTVSSVLTLSGSGRIRRRVVQVTDDANKNIDPADGDTFYIDGTTMTTGRTWTIIGGDIGDRVTCRTFDSTRTLTVNGSGGQSRTLQFATGQYEAVTFEKIGSGGTTWVVVSDAIVP